MKRALLVPLNAFNSWALIVLVLLVASRIGEQPPTIDVVVASGSCYSCITEYVKELQAASEGVGILEIEIIFFKENNTAQVRLDEIHRRLEVPVEMQRDMAVILNDKYLLNGPVPVDSIVDFLENHLEDYSILVV